MSSKAHSNQRSDSKERYWWTPPSMAWTAETTSDHVLKIVTKNTFSESNVKGIKT